MQLCLLLKFGSQGSAKTMDVKNYNDCLQLVKRN